MSCAAATAPPAGILFGIAAMLLVGASWIIAGVVTGRAPREGIRISAFCLLSGLAGLAVSAGAGLCRGLPDCGGAVHLLVLLSLAASGVCNYLQLETMSRAMQRGPNGIVWAVAQAGFVVPSLMGVVCFHNVLTPVKLSGFACMLAMLLLFAFGGRDRRPGPGGGSGGGGWKAPALATFLCTGASQSLVILPSYLPQAQAVSSQWRNAYFSLGLAIAALASFLGRHGRTALRDLREDCRNPRLWSYCALLQGVELSFAFLFLYPGMDCLARARLGAIAFPLMVASCIATFELYCLAVLKEKRNPAQILGLALCLLGIITICL